MVIFHSYVNVYQRVLVGGLTILKNMKVNGKDYPIYEMENTKKWNHQPGYYMVNKNIRSYNTL